MQRRVNQFSFFILYLILFSLSACLEIPDEFVLPEWDVELNVPFADIRYAVSDIIREQKYISIDGTTGDSIYVLESDIYEVNKSVSDFIHLASFNAVQNTPLLMNDTSFIKLYLDFPEGAELDSAVFSSGWLLFKISNPSSEEVTISFEIPGICSPKGEQFYAELAVGSTGYDSVRYDVSNYTYRVPSGQPIPLRNKLELKIRSQTAGSGQVLVYMDFSSSNFLLSFVSGIMPAKSLGVHRRSFQFVSDNLLDFRGKIFLRDASMKLAAQLLTGYNDPFPVELRDFNIIGKRNDGTLFYLRDSTSNENLLVRFEDGSFERYFNQSNSNITELISFLPDSIVLVGDYIVNPDQVNGTISIKDSIEVDNHFSIKSMIALKRSNLVDSSETILNGSDRDKITNCRYASVFLEISNAIPLSTWLRIDLVDENHNHLFTVTENSNGIDSIYIDAANVDGNGEVTGPNINPPIIIELDSTRIDQLSRVHYAVYSMNVNTNDAYSNPPEFVALRPSAWINIKAYGRVKYHIDPDDF